MPPVDEAKEEAERHWQAVAFRSAVERGDAETVEELLSSHPFLPTHRMSDGSSWTVLMLAAYSGQAAFAEKFTKGGRMPRIEERDPNGFQAIMLAALRGHRDIVQILLDKKAEVNVKDETGETPLMKASAAGHQDVVQLLLEAQADPNALDCNDMSAIKKAARWGHSGCLKELLPRVEDNPRQLKHCLLFGKLNGHDEVIAEMTKILEEPAPSESEALADTEAAVVSS
mmetsp:Transcript_34805/g.75895  ORF Transcript_34805/g.75895 Transcript_34805/m.75895 type:complete len:228 (-) Transcript_34805:86-769(-)|eukprot:CAMPEP_0170608140 /NCGR_PEP_ID=MMETSP0224-20130122/21427_1 /TAXON_ID=285029 /ORGANISM="Togula jolla, Strain CCCM 725" /LENGTH=227 /DNA_ID=CAMNT_0010933349 /DNA_START=80 /DNA_END=763 /DNA_ORIENTATION=+